LEDLTLAEGGGCGASEQCSLRGAMAGAGSEGGTIEFAVSGRIQLEHEQHFEAAEAPIQIKGQTAPGYEGAPVVELDGSNLGEGNGSGIEIGTDAPGSTIEGLAIGGFTRGVKLMGSASRLCGNHIGVDTFGFVATPNGRGVEIYPTAEGSEIGAGCGQLGGNVISANDEYGIVDEGNGTLIAANLIGVNSFGGGLGNEGDGIDVTDEAEDTVIGGATSAAANTIADNERAGVSVEAGERSRVAIRRNSIFGNEQKGISFVTEAPTPPTLTAVEAPGAGESTFHGQLTTAVAETVELDFYASESCDPSGHGEGQAYVGSASFDAPGGTVPYAVSVSRAIPLGYEEVTATANAADGTTTEFSECVHYTQGPRTFVVNTLLDETDPGECTATCSLRDAIELANLSAAKDTIEFSVAGTIEAEGEGGYFVEGPVEIDGSSAPGFAGKPRITVDGSNTSSEGGGTEGFDFGPDSGGSLLDGIAVGGFHYGVYLENTSPSQICGSYLGLDPNSEAALANVIGVETSDESAGDLIGAECGGRGGNVISGNEELGIADYGDGTRISANRIGVDASGGAVPNGTGDEEVRAGILVDSGATGAFIGGDGDSPANVIADNEEAGVFVEDSNSRIGIRGNSIYGNGGDGISIGGPPPPRPELEETSTAGGEVTIAGALPGEASSSYELDFFASASCDPSGFGQGQTYLGSATVETDAGGGSLYGVSFATSSVPAGQDQITATATDVETGTSGEFSGCHTYVPPPEEAEEEKKPPPPPPPGPSPPLVQALVGPKPVNGAKVVIAPKEGKVKIKLPGSSKFVPLTEIKQVPVGAIIDATNGKVTLTSIDAAGNEQSAVFFGGVFKVVQRSGNGLVVLKLLDTFSCPATASAGKASASAAHGSGKLWGSGHGNFRTEGNNGAATVRGTIWLVEDRCDETTFFRTRRGVVSVRDFAKGKTLSVPAGKTYVAGPG
jgi:CSLREA domain-containing protein